MTGAGVTGEGRFVVHCEVSGGVTGHRTSLLKSNGAILLFATLAQAEERAQYLSASMNGPHARATFRYWAAELSDLGQCYLEVARRRSL